MPFSDSLTIRERAICWLFFVGYISRRTISDNIINTIIQGETIEEMKRIADGSVDMILADLPYGTTACKWDTIIPFEPLWEQYKRIIKPNGAIVLFGSEPFSSELRKSNINAYSYDLKWIKNSVTRFLTVETMPLKRHEDIMVFYFEDYLKEIGELLKKRREEKKLTKKYMDEQLGTNTLYSFFEGRTLRGEKVYSLPNAEHWKKLCEILDIPSELAKRLYPQKKTYNHVNIQDIEKNIGARRRHREDSHYSFNSIAYTQLKTNYNDDILLFDRERDNIHPTQKPVGLIEYLICVYTNSGETVLDNVMGSGTTAVAAINTGRQFIGIEREEEYVKIARERVKQAYAERDKTGVMSND